MPIEGWGGSGPPPPPPTLSRQRFFPQQMPVSLMLFALPKGSADLLLIAIAQQPGSSFWGSLQQPCSCDAFAGESSCW